MATKKISEKAISFGFNFYQVFWDNESNKPLNDFWREEYELTREEYNKYLNKGDIII